MNQVFFGIILVACLVGAASGNMGAVSTGALDGAKAAVDLSIGLVGYMALFLGLMKIAEEGGMLRILARSIRPLMVRLFPDVPPDHPAMGAMILNIGANMLGLGNAATPLGIKAMKELDSLNPHRGVATNAMVLFLALNTSGLALLPSGVVGVLAREGSTSPWDIMASTLFATSVATLVGVTAAKLLQRLPMFAPPAPGELGGEEDRPPAPADAEEDSEQVKELMAIEQEEVSTLSVLLLRSFLLLGTAVLVGPALAAVFMDASNPLSGQLRDFTLAAGQWVIPVLILSLISFGQLRGVKVYEVFVQGAKEGFSTGVTIIPFLVAILAAVGMFRGAGAMDVLTSGLSALSEPLHVPGEVLPMALVRPLSGSGAFGLMAELVQTHGPDSYIGRMAATMQGSTDTTFYVLAVYFGSVGVTRARHAVLAGLAADLAGFLAAAFVCAVLFSHLA
ncbi:MAG: spore maturation protein [Alphaproteobacteria bacterium]|nr:spore maturation protein [Alphaproteobacteria bacterium]MCB9794274.1 spore maturation protein [Alphaproteobacteria bacterium]